MLQIAVPSRTDVREYQDLKLEMDQLIGCINGRFTTPNWSPIRYIYGCVSQDELAAFYREAAVALVTPLRDGMNLVAKEFVACQINKPPGVLIVSPFAGAGEMMHEALICNPYEIDEAAEMIHRYLGHGYLIDRSDRLRIYLSPVPFLIYLTDFIPSVCQSSHDARRRANVKNEPLASSREDIRRQLLDEVFPSGDGIARGARFRGCYHDAARDHG